MALQLDKFVQGLIDFQDPQKRDDRQIVKSFIAKPMAAEADAVLEGLITFAEKCSAAVDKGIITPEQAERMVANRESLSNATITFTTRFLKSE